MADESLVIENENLLELAPGQDKGTTHILFDKKCEELAFPKIFFRGKFGYTFPREHHLTPKLTAGMFVITKINCRHHQLTAGMFANYDESVKRFVSNDQGFLFMNQIQGTPAYWKKFQREFLAMVKQLDCPIFF